MKFFTINPIIRVLAVVVGFLMVATPALHNREMLVAFHITALVLLAAGAIIGLCSSERLKKRKVTSALLLGLLAWVCFDILYRDAGVGEMIVFVIGAIPTIAYFFRPRLGPFSARRKPIHVR